MANLITEFISLMIDLGIINAIVSLIVSLISGLILLKFASKIAENRVSQYQQAKDSNMIRESLLKLFSEFYLSFTRMSSVINEYLSMRERIETIDTKEKLPKEFFTRLRSCMRDFEFRLGEFETLTGLLISRVETQLELTTKQKDTFLEFIKVVNEYKNNAHDIRADKTTKISLVRDIKGIIHPNEIIMTGKIKIS